MRSTAMSPIAITALPGSRPARRAGQEVRGAVRHIPAAARAAGAQGGPYPGGGAPGRVACDVPYSTASPVSWMNASSSDPVCSASSCSVTPASAARSPIRSIGAPVTSSARSDGVTASPLLASAAARSVSCGDRTRIDV